MKHKECSDAECQICKNEKPFDLPQDIVDAIKRENLVIFAGAAISTENKLVYPFSLYEQIKNELKIKSYNGPFSELMSEYCIKNNGKRNLLNKIKDRFEYLHTFPELYREASKFHKELATIYQIKEIITTNWDDLFERECGAIPIVIPEDFIFWDSPMRKILKIHGSINNIGSIVATKEDYKKCYKNLQKNIIGSYLKTLLATRTVIFVGYSFRDEEFNKIYKFLKSEMKELNPHAYLVTLDSSSKDKFKNKNITVIETDATYFIKILKEKLVECEYLLSDKIFEGIPNILDFIIDEHNKIYERLSSNSYPEIHLTACYQDGLIHAFERILSTYKTGMNSNEEQIINSMHSYEHIIEDKEKKGLYHDVAYFEGYLNGISYLVFDEDQRKNLPIYFLFGVKKDIKTFRGYKKILMDKRRKKHGPSYKYAKNLLLKKDGLVVHHTPFL